VQVGNITNPEYVTNIRELKRKPEYVAESLENLCGTIFVNPKDYEPVVGQFKDGKQIYKLREATT
jgi:hypothetical protein